MPGKTVLIETGGHRSIANVPAGVIRIMDVKCPGSGESDKNDWSNFAHLTTTDEVKFVIADRTRLRIRARHRAAREPAGARQRGAVLARARRARSRSCLSEWVIADRLDVRVQLQVHKYIWSPETRGV